MSAPTYDPSLPGLTAEQAAQVVARTLVTRPRLLVPWWVRVSAPIAAVAPGPVDAATVGVLRLRERAAHGRPHKAR
jgi:hypothetical protein